MQSSSLEIRVGATLIRDNEPWVVEDKENDMIEVKHAETEETDTWSTNFIKWADNIKIKPPANKP